MEVLRESSRYKKRRVDEVVGNNIKEEPEDKRAKVDQTEAGSIEEVEQENLPIMPNFQHTSDQQEKINKKEVKLPHDSFHLDFNSNKLFLL